MAAGLVMHDITTSSGVTFQVASWVPNTAAPNVGAVPVALITDGTNVVSLVGGRLPVDGSGVTQPVSGSVTATVAGTPAVTLSGTANNVITEVGQLLGTAPTGASKPPPLVVHNDTPSTPHANGTTTYLQVDGSGKLWVNTGQLPVQLNGAGANSATTQRVAIIDEQLGTLVLGSVPVITGGSDWYVYGPSTGFTPVQAAAGAAGDYLEAILAVVTTTSSQIQVRDSASGSSFTILPSGITTIGSFPLALGWRSKAGRWEVSTGAGVTAFVSGKFS